MPRDRARRIWVTGMMGSGKSTVGEALATRLGWPLVDTDAVVEQRAGRSIAQLWADEGETAFRACEAQAVAELAGAVGPAVIAVGGGCVVDPANRAAMAGSGLVVWLRAEIATLAGRVGSGETRPLLGTDPEGSLRRVAASRHAYYEQADVVVDVDGMTPGEAADAIVELAGGALERA